MKFTRLYRIENDMGFFEITATIVLIVAANLVARTRLETYYKLFDLSLLMINGPIFIQGIWFVFQKPENVLVQNHVGFGIGLQLMAVWGVIWSFRSSRHSIERFLPIDPHSPVHALALVLSGYLIGTQFIQLTQGGIPPITLLSSALGELMFVLIAFLGVGGFIRRDYVAIWSRLGLERPSLRQIGEAIGWIVLLVIIQSIALYIWESINPEQIAAVDESATKLYSQFDTAWEWFILAAAAGVGEEILFRGAIQPVLGIWVTAVLFAIIHIQYGFLTPATLALFIIAVLLGIIRRRHNTTTAIFVHIGYDFALGLITLAAAVIT